MPENELSRRFVIEGRVQGVGFRDSVCRVAWKLGGLKGHVRNLRDGSVEVCVSGEARKVEELRDYLRRGPPLARVDSFAEHPLVGALPAGPFTTIYGG